MASGATTDLAVIVGRNIRAAREAAGLTQRELALALGRGEAQRVSDWERGVHRPSDDYLMTLSQVLGIPLADFYADERSAA